jgi:dienelactone hydrolase
MSTAATMRRSAVLVMRPWAALRALGRGIGAALDGAVLGMTVGYLALTALGAPAFYLGVPWPVAMIVVGGAATLAALGGAAVARSAVWLIGRIGVTAAAFLERRGRRRLSLVVAVPVRVVRGLPAGTLGAFGMLLWIALVGKTMGPLALLTPPGILSAFIYLAGIAGALIGLSRAIMPVRDHVHHATARRRAGRLVALGAVAVLVGSAAVAIDPGSTNGLIAYDPAFDGLRVPTALQDPGAPGQFAVETLSYGSGRDARRPAFGSDADVITPTIDASKILRELGGGADEVRSWFFGFDTAALPLDGLVWRPQGTGPFPLVLIVHGNHAMGEFSEEGYAYLGEHLASRGYVAVSVDEDFLNGSWVGEWEGSEQLVRAWLLLAHLDLWRSWNADDTSPFHDLVDLDRIALIGHSRGGEAASAAAALATSKRPPRGGMTPWPTGLRVRAVVSIAPSDGQYQANLQLRDVDFLTLAGGYDADARAWSGIRQYGRTEVDGQGFKAGLWAYRANHGQFNTVWGRGDFGPFSGALLDLAPLLEPDEQQDIARTAIGAFLEASLKGEDGYRGFFRRPMVGREWLPDDIVLVRSLEGTARPLTTIDPGSPIDGVTVVRDGVDHAIAIPIPLRALQPEQAMRGLRIDWMAGDGSATWGLAGLNGAVDAPISGSTELRFALADGSPSDTGRSKPMEVIVEVVTTSGMRASLSLSRFGALPPPLPVRLVKHELLTQMSAWDVSLRDPAERVLQSYAIPLSAFEAAEPAFRPEDIDRFELHVPRTSDGAIWLAEVGLGG